MKTAFLFFCIWLFSPTVLAQEALSNDIRSEESKELSDVQFKSGSVSHDVSQFIKIIFIFMGLMVLLAGLLVFVKKYNKGLPVAFKAGDSRVRVSEYKRMPGGVEITIFKVDEQEYILIKNNNSFQIIDA